MSQPSEPLNKVTADEMLKQGYPVRHTEWLENEFIYMQEGIIYDEEDELTDFDTKVNPAALFFEFHREDETCETTDESGVKVDGEHQSKQKTEEEKTKIENEHLSTSSESESLDESTTQETSKLSMNDSENTIKTTKRPVINEKTSTEKPTETSKMKLSASTIPETELINSRRYTLTGKSVTQLSDSTEQSNNLNLVQSQSMNLIDSSANHLYSLMKSVTPNPDSEIYTTGSVEMSVKIAKELREVMKLKLETLKFAKQLKE